MSIFQNVFPLAEKLVLHEVPKCYFVRIIGFFRLRIGVDAEIVLPLVPRFVAKGRLQRHKISVVVEPVGVVVAKRFEIGRFGKTRVRFFEQSDFVFKQPTVIGLLANVTSGFQLVLVKQTFLIKRLRVDIVMIACKRRRGLIGTVAVCRGIERQDLPTLRLGGNQKIYEPLARRAKRAYAPFARKRTDCHQYSALVFESEIIRHSFLFARALDCVNRHAKSIYFNITY